MSIDYYDKHSRLLTREQYHDLLISIGPEYKRVGLNNVGEISISTVWLGLDHQYGDGPPLIFETMQFGGEADQEMARYSTLEEAHAGHDAWVKRVKEAAK